MQERELFGEPCGKCIRLCAAQAENRFLGFILFTEYKDQIAVYRAARMVKTGAAEIGRKTFIAASGVDEVTEYTV